MAFSAKLVHARTAAVVSATFVLLGSAAVRRRRLARRRGSLHRELSVTP